MNIWLLTGEYPPEYGGGIATYAYHTARMLSERGHAVTVFAGSESQPSGSRGEEMAGRVRVVRFGLNQTPPSAALGEFARWSYDAAAVLGDYSRREGLPDALESQEYLGLPYFTLQRRWLKEKGFENLPILVTGHTPLYLCYRYDGVPQYRFPGWWVGEMERFSLRAADRVIFPSVRLKEEICKELPLAAEKAAVIPNPFRGEEALQPVAAQGRHGFLFTAKIQRRKGIEVLLRAFARLWDEGLDEPLILLGGDWYDELHQRWMGEVLQTQYRAYIERGVLDWRGKQPPQIVRQTLNEVRGMILPSLFENYPYAVLEAMSAGCPVIVSDSGGHAEMVEDGVSGFVFSHQQPGGLEEKISALLALSEAAWQRMSEAAQRRVRELSAYEAVAPQKERAIEKAMEQARRQDQRLFPFVRGVAVPPSRPNPAEQEQKGLLSIVIPFYNLGDYLEDTLRSLSDLQDVPHEILVVDDGSDDPNSIQKVEELREQFSFRLVRTENQGLASSRNMGAMQARGEFLAFLDADDRVDVAYYRRALDVLQSYPDVSFVGCWAEYFGAATGYWPTWNPEPPYALAHNPLNTSALVYRRAVFLRYGLNDPQFRHGLEDYDSLLSLLENNCRGVSIPDPYFKYRVRHGSMLRRMTAPITMTTYERLIEKHKRLYQQYADEVISLINTNGPGYWYDNPTLWYPALGFIQESAVTDHDATSKLGMPPAPARVYFYFAFRAMLVGIYRRIERFWPGIHSVKDRVKKLIIR